MQNKNSFLGKGWAFPPEFSHNDNPTRMSNVQQELTYPIYFDSNR